MASISAKIATLALEYIYPAYKCYKCMEVRKPDIEQVQLWCQYWIIIAILTFLERLMETLVSWLPLYNEVKLAFIVYLWHPKTKGTTHVYTAFIKPFVSKYEVDAYHNLMRLRRRAIDISAVYWKYIAVYAQLKFFELLQFISQSLHASPPPGLENSK